MIIYVKFFLLLTLHHSIGFGQILIQILMKKQGIRISGPLSSSAVKTWIKPLISILIRTIFIFGPLQGLVIGWSYLGVGSLFAEFKSNSENLANTKKDCPWLKSILKKLRNANSFLGIFGNFRGELYHKVALDKLFFYVLRTMRLIIVKEPATEVFTPFLTKGLTI